MPGNMLFYGDNLDVLRGRDADGRPLIADESVDLVYLDPPFNSAANYNVLFRAPDGKASDSQIEAFEDTWHWTDSAAQAFHEVVTGRHHRAGTLLRAMRDALGENDMMAYLAMMAVRLVELHRVLKPTGSLYLHCDPTASHYLKLLLDGIFGPENFKNEIIWGRTNARSTDGRWPRIHDVILFYTKSSDFNFKSLKVPGSKHKLPHTLITGADGKKYQTYELTAPGATKDGESGKAWRGFDPNKWARHWANAHSHMDALDAKGLIHWPKNGGFPRERAAEPFNPDAREVVVGSVWTDIDRLNQTARERLGYPTQKPLALLERIITASSNPGDVVLDPFCGCGTTVHAAQRLGRRWIGMDITHLAISLIERRLKDAFPDTLDDKGRPSLGVRFDVHGVPRDLASARDLAARDKHQFQWWAVSLVDAVPQGGSKKGADRGIDGIRWVKTGPRPEDVDRIIVSVKGGGVGAKDVRDLVGTVEREKALGGLLITLEKPTRDMLKEAASHGFASYGLGEFRKIMVKTVDELLRNVQDGNEVLPPLGRQEGFRRAARERSGAKGQQAALDL